MDGRSDVSSDLPAHRQRVEAFGIDVAVVAVVFGLAVVLDKLTNLSWTGLVIVALAGWLYYVATTVWLMDGQTAGKAICGLRVGRVGAGTPPRTVSGLLWSVGRHSVGYVVADVFLVGSLLAMVDRRRRCVHDYAFGSVVSVDAGAVAVQGSFAARYRAYWERFSERYDDLTSRNRWFFFPWRWISKALIVIAVLVDKVLPGQASAAVAPAEPAMPLSTKAAAGLWATTAVTTAVVAVGAWPSGTDPIVNLNIVTGVESVGEPDTSEINIMRADGTDVRQLTRNDSLDGGPDLFADRLVVFESERDGNLEIYVMDADGSDQTRLTDDPDVDYCAAWSPDGRDIAFASNRDGNYEIYVMDADGSDQTRITRNRADDVCPTWSPDGDRIAFTSARDGNWEIYTMRIDGSDTQRITDNPAADREATWSPDGTRIAFTSDRDGDENIYHVTLDGDLVETRVTDHPDEDDSPIWAPDGDALIFWSDRGFGAEGGAEIYVAALDGTNLTRLTSFNNCGPDTSTCDRG